MGGPGHHAARHEIVVGRPASARSTWSSRTACGSSSPAPTTAPPGSSSSSSARSTAARSRAATCRSTTCRSRSCPAATHVLQVRAVDDLDNVDPTPAVHTFATEGEPETTILTGPARRDRQHRGDLHVLRPTSAGRDVRVLARPGRRSRPARQPRHVHRRALRRARARWSARSARSAPVDLTPAEFSWASGDLTPPIVDDPRPGPPSRRPSTTATFTFSADDPDVAVPVLARRRTSLDVLRLGRVDRAPAVERRRAHLRRSRPPSRTCSSSAMPAVWDVDGRGRRRARDGDRLRAAGADRARHEPAVFVFSSNEAGRDVRVRARPAARRSRACAAPPDNRGRVRAAWPAQHTLLVRAVDPSLNVDVDAGRPRTWTVVGAAGDDDHRRARRARARAPTRRSPSFDQPGVHLRVRARRTPCSPRAPRRTTFSDLADGDHTFEVRATNRSALVEDPPAEYAWTVDGRRRDRAGDDDRRAARRPRRRTRPRASPSRRASSTSTFECSLDGVGVRRLRHAVRAHRSGGRCPQPSRSRRPIAAGNVDGSPAGYTWTVTAPPAPNTPIGTDVTVPVTAADGAPPPSRSSRSPLGLRRRSTRARDARRRCRDGYVCAGRQLTTTSPRRRRTPAPVTSASAVRRTRDEPVRLLHFDGGAWVDITTSSDPVAGVVCGERRQPVAVRGRDRHRSRRARDDDRVRPAGLDRRAPTRTSPSPRTTRSRPSSARSTIRSTGARARSTHDVHGPARRRRTSCSSAPRTRPAPVDATPARHQWTVTPLPETTILSGPVDADREPDGDVHLRVRSAGRQLRVPPRRRGLRSRRARPGSRTPDLPFDEHDFLVRAVDAAGQRRPDARRVQLGDRRHPARGHDRVRTGRPRRRAGAPTFVFSAPEAGLSFECPLDSGAVVALRLAEDATTACRSAPTRSRCG